MALGDAKPTFCPFEVTRVQARLQSGLGLQVVAGVGEQQGGVDALDAAQPGHQPLVELFDGPQCLAVLLAGKLASFCRLQVARIGPRIPPALCTAKTVRPRPNTQVGHTIPISAVVLAVPTRPGEVGDFIMRESGGSDSSPFRS